MPSGAVFFDVGPDPSGVNQVGLMGIYPHDGRDATLPFHEVMKQGDDALKKICSPALSGRWLEDQ